MDWVGLYPGMRVLVYRLSQGQKYVLTAGEQGVMERGVKIWVYEPYKESLPLPGAFTRGPSQQTLFYWRKLIAGNPRGSHQITGKGAPLTRALSTVIILHRSGVI